MLQTLATASLYQAFLQTLGGKVSSSSEVPCRGNAFAKDLQFRVLEAIPDDELREICDGFYSEGEYSIVAGSLSGTYFVYIGNSLVTIVVVTNLSSDEHLRKSGFRRIVVTVTPH